MKIYVAARFTEKAHVQQAYDRLRQLGHEITADWTKHANVKPYDEHSDQAGNYAAEDMAGVINADVFILLTSPEAGSGVSTELGGAIVSKLATGRPKIYIVGDHLHTNAFFFHPMIDGRKGTLDEVARELR